MKSLRHGGAIGAIGAAQQAFSEALQGSFQSGLDNSSLFSAARQIALE